MLELGSGLGLASVCLAKLGFEVTASDNDDQCIEYLAKNRDLNSV